MRYYLPQFILQQYHHGGIGLNHIEVILGQNGYQPLYFPVRGRNKFLLKLSRIFFAIKIWLQLSSKDELVFVYPVYAKVYKALIKSLAKKKLRIICVLGDIDGIRDKNDALLKMEIEFFKPIKYFVAHNATMAEGLPQILDGKVVSQLDFFDFLVNIPVPRPQRSNQIVFAGNLEKSSFLSDLCLLKPATALHFNLYGPGGLAFDKIKSIATWRGVFTPAELLGNIAGSYGLIWDGADFEKPDNVLGEYLRIITPHKASLYVLCRLPLIVPVDTAVSALVEQFEIGISIRSLHEIEERIAHVSDAAYIKMQENMRPIADKISKGEMLLSALAKFH